MQEEEEVEDTSDNNNENGNNTASGGRFRLRSDQLFLTYPHCYMAKEEVMSQLKTMAVIGPLYKGSVVCREPHADGTPHIHCYVALKSQLVTYDCHVADLVDAAATVYHGHYEGCRSPKAIVCYVVELGDYIVDNVDLATLPGRVAKMPAIYKMLRRGATDEEIAALFPGIWLLNMSKLDAARKRILSWKKTSPPILKVNLSPSSVERQIMTWLVNNLWPPSPRPRRAAQLYIHGDTQTGKTTLVENLAAAGVRVFFFPYERDGMWVEGYADNKYDVIVFDEFDGQVPLTFMNSFIDGSTKYIPQRHGGVWKSHNIAVIVLSNRVPEDYYPPTVSANQFAAFRSRFEFINIGTNKISVIL